MLNNAKIDKTMAKIIEECESGDCIYSPAELDAIAVIMYEGISKGENFDRIYETRLEQTYPLPRGTGLIQSHICLRQLYEKMVKKYKKAVAVDKERLFDEVYSRLEEIYWKEHDDENIQGQKSTLIQLKDLIRHALSEKALNSANENQGEVQYHLDFNL